MKKKVLTAVALSIPMLISSGNITSAETNILSNVNPNSPESQELSNYQNQQKQVVNIETAAREAIPGYARFIHGQESNVSVIINNVQLIDVEEKYIDPDYSVQTKLLSKGPEKLVQSIEEDIYNDHPSAELTKSHTFQHGISNTSTLTKSITHSHKAGVKFTYKAKVDFLVAGSELGGEVAYEYTNSNQNGTSDSRTFSKTFSSTASAKLPPKSKGKLVSNVYTSPAFYEIKSRSLFTGSVQFSYVLANDPDTLHTENVSLFELLRRTDEDSRDKIMGKYNMWSQTYWDPETGEGIKALAFEGVSILNIDDKYRTETRLVDIKEI